MAITEVSSLKVGKDADDHNPCSVPHMLHRCLIYIIYYFKYKTHILHIFPVEKLRCILSSKNVHLSNFFPKTYIQKLDVSYIRSNMVYQP
jgi:hypothetical protein